MSQQAKHQLISTIIQHPQTACDFSLKDWDVLVRLARRANILGMLYYFLCDEQIKKHIPEKVFCHFQAQANFDLYYRNAVKLECQRIADILNSINVPCVVLKGGAYVVADLPVSFGRLFSDIDLLVPKPRITEVEQLLKLHGWMSGPMDAYDDKYYRQWMHEIPPLHHIKRSTSLDVHHAILPETAKLKPDSQLLLKDIVAVGDNLYVLAPIDMVLHSMTHLFHEGELEHGMRDLIDLDGLLKHYLKLDDRFWEKLLTRAELQDLSLPLYYALRYLKRILNSPIPVNVIVASQALVGGEKKIMDIFFDRALLPDHKICNDGFTAVARWCLYVRSHYLRMPFRLLIPHLIRKAYVKRKEKIETQVDEKNDR